MGLPRGVFAGVAAAGRDDADAGSGRIRMVSWLAVPSMEALKRSTMSVSRRRRMASVSGSPKRVLNSRTMGPRGVIMMPQKRTPLKGCARRACRRRSAARRCWRSHCAHGWGGDAVGGVGAHAAGVGAGVAFADALVVLRGGELRSRALPSQRAKKESSSPVEELFEDDLGLRRCREACH